MEGLVAFCEKALKEFSIYLKTLNPKNHKNFIDNDRHKMAPRMSSFLCFEILAT